MQEHITEILVTFGFVVTLLISVLAWIGSRVHNRLDELTKTVNQGMLEVHNIISALERSIRHDQSIMDSRLSKIEGRCETRHGGG